MRSTDFFTDLEAQLMSAHDRRAARRLPNLARPTLAVGLALVAAAIAIAALLVALTGGDTPNPTSDRGAPASARQSTFSPPPVPDHGEGMPVPERQRGRTIICAVPDPRAACQPDGSAPGPVRAAPKPRRTPPRRPAATHPAPRPVVPIISEGGGSDGPVPGRRPSRRAPRVAPPPASAMPPSDGSGPVISEGGGEEGASTPPSRSRRKPSKPEPVISGGAAGGNDD